ncbi:hypothetical protein AAMO2058_000227300 [Amorphochlora amoebiformis]
MSDWLVKGVIAGVGISMLPLAIDVVNAAFPNYKIARATSTVVQPVLAFFVFFIAVACLNFFFFSYLPYTLFLDDKLFHDRAPPTAYCTTPQEGCDDRAISLADLYSKAYSSSHRAYAHTVFALWAWINVVYNFTKAVLTDAGTRDHPEVSKFANPGEKAEMPRGKPRDRVVRKASGTKEEKAKNSEGRKSKTTRVCPSGVCNGRPKVPGFRHCRVCRVCVALLDHHCPFTGNCVGSGNFLFFFLFLAYCSLGLLYSLVVSSRAFYICVILPPASPMSLDRQWCSFLGTNALLALPVAAALLAVSSLFAFHTLLLSFDRTTIQFCTAFPEFSSWFSLTSWRKALGVAKSESIVGRVLWNSNRSSKCGKFWEVGYGFWWIQVLVPVGMGCGINPTPRLERYLSDVIEVARQQATTSTKPLYTDTGKKTTRHEGPESVGCLGSSHDHLD